MTNKRKKLPDLCNSTLQYNYGNERPLTQLENEGDGLFCLAFFFYL